MSDLSIPAQHFTELSGHLGGVANRVFRAGLQTGIGRSFFEKVLGHLALPAFHDLEKAELAKLKEAEDKPKSLNETKMQKIQRFLKENFAWGDILSIGSFLFAGLLTHHARNKDDRAGFTQRLFRNLCLACGIGGSLSALLGRMFGFHKKIALKENYHEAKMREAERQSGKKIFHTYTPEEINHLIKQAGDLDRILVYKPGVRDLVQERYLCDYSAGLLGGLFDGEPGTGKTEGVNLITGNWAKRVLGEGKQPVIASLNLAHYDEYLQANLKQKNELLLLMESGLDPNLNMSSVLTENQGLLILELLIKKINDLAREIKTTPQAGKKRELVIVIDEFDKVFDPKTLKGCDKARLKNLLLQFHELYVKENLLLTSNRSLESILEDLKAALKVNEQEDGREVWGPFYDRLASKNRIIIENPGREEQGQIIAGRLLAGEFRDAIAWNQFGIQGASRIFETDRARLGKAISETVIGASHSAMNGRNLRYACDDLKLLLLGRAKDLRLAKQLQISDQEWDKLDPAAKIKITGAQIDPQMLRQALDLKAHNMQEHDNKVSHVFFETLFTEYLPLFNKALQMKSAFGTRPLSLNEILDLTYTKTVSEIKDTYQSKNTINLNGKRYNHSLIHHKTRSITAKADSYSIILADEKTGDIEYSNKMTKEELEFVMHKGLKKSLDNQLVQTLKTIIQGARGQSNPRQRAKVVPAAEADHDLTASLGAALTALSA